MAEQLNVKTLIEFILNKSGADQARTELGKLKTSTDQASGSFAGLSRSAGAFVTGFIGVAGITAVTRLVAGSVSESARLERAFNAIRLQLQGMGGDAAAELPRVRAFLEALQNSGAMLQRDSVPAFQRFLGITGDVEAALYAVRLAADVGASGIMDTSDAAARLTRLLQGSAEGAEIFGVAVRDNNGELRTAGDIIDELNRRYGGLAATVDDTTSKIDSATGIWKTFREELGRGVSSIGEWLGTWKQASNDIANDLASKMRLFFGGLNVMKEGLLGFGNLVLKAFDFRSLIGGDYIGEVTKAFDAASARIKAAATATAMDVAEVWADGGKKQIDHNAALNTLKNQANEKAAGEDRKRQEKDDADRLKKEQDLAADRLAFERETQDEILQLQLQLTKEGSEERLKAEKKVLERMREHALSEAARLGADEVLVRQQFRLMEEELVQAHEDASEEKARERAERRAEFQAQMLQEQIDAEYALLADTAIPQKLVLQLEALELERQQAVDEATRLGADVERVEQVYRLRKKALETRADAEERQRARRAALEKIDLAMYVAQAGVALGRAVFGENKALAIGEAVIFTALGVARALKAADPPINFIMAAAVAAAGAAQIAAISSAEPGGGGGAPSIGAASSLGSSASSQPAAPSQVPAFGSSGAGTDQTPGSAQSGGVSIVINGNVYGGKAGMAELSRELAIAGERDRSKRQG